MPTLTAPSPAAARPRLVKTLAAELKVSDGGPGQFAGYAAAYNLDLVGDTILPGAFVNLASFVEAGALLLEHDPTMPVGTISSAKEDARGLLVAGEFLPTERGQEARQVAAERIRRKKAVGLSFAFDILRYSYKGGVRVLEQLAIWEASIVGRPANPAAGLVAVKDRLPRRTPAEIRARLVLVNAALWLEEHRRQRMIADGRLDLWRGPRPSARSAAVRS